jgi:molecular chaperone DnaJ
MSQNNPFDILAVPVNASDKDIKKAFRALALKWHPDRNPDSPEAETQFREINWAYEQLKDPEQRKAWVNYKNQKNAGKTGHGFSWSELFRRTQKADPNGGYKPTGEVVKATLTLTLEQAFTGGEFSVEGISGQYCLDCGGTGKVTLPEMKLCLDCGGEGRIEKAQGMMRLEAICPSCNGVGRTNIRMCSTCKGTGINQNGAGLVPVPAGVADGHVIRWGANGATMITVSIKPHDVFVRKGDDLEVTYEVSLWDAILGGKIEFRGLGGEGLRVTVPEGTHYGQKLCIRGRGMPKEDGTRGNLLLRVVFSTPKATPELRQHIEALRDGKAGKAGVVSRGNSLNVEA